MVNATVDNKPVSIQLKTGQSTTVPSNETWVVQLTLTVENGNIATAGAVLVNGTEFIGAANNNEKSGQIAPDTVLVGGDTVSLTGGLGVGISGFVVNS